MKWRATYIHDRHLEGLSPLVVEVEAPDEATAKMKAGMARAESFEGKFAKSIYAPKRLRWTRLSLERID